MTRSARPLLLVVIPGLIMSISLASLYFVIFPLFPRLHQHYFQQQSSTFATYHAALYTHIAFGTIALFLGSIHVFNALRGKRFDIYRFIGASYAVAVSVASVCALIMAFHAFPGKYSYGRPLVTSGFLTLAILWFGTLYAALYQIAIKNDVRRHMFYMVLNFSLTFAAVTLRLEIAPFVVHGTQNNGFNTVYPFLGWLCWLPNIVVGYLLARRLYAGQPIIVPGSDVSGK